MRPASKPAIHAALRLLASSSTAKPPTARVARLVYTSLRRKPQQRSINLSSWSPCREKDAKQEAKTPEKKGVSTSSGVHSAQTLPELPDAPKYPCPHLSDEEVVKYLQPLYARSWYLGLQVVKWNGQLRTPLVLAKKMDFLTYDDSLKFAGDLSGIVKSENHHPQVSLSPSGRLSLEINTHSATIPGVCPPARKDPQHIYPGVTLRDVRLAMLVETLWEQHRDELKVAKEEQYVTNPSRKLDSVRKNSGYRALGFFKPPSFADDLWRNVKPETVAYIIADEMGSR
ncbi:hypothetical protein EIP91_002779 [Steccherinum ochraceum]|uniref:Uncharacterized protein n=1 Tax=Steccherinum ochraceum TaxID=92696 RepID=A0A4R0RBJ8_9APHY|nr:hypothetical protein EIP91_002779 [Steccherinum ochraceum]